MSKVKEGIILYNVGNDKHVNIPEEKNGFPVTELGDSALRDKKNLISASFPSSIVKGNIHLFENCPNVKSVDFSQVKCSFEDFFDIERLKGEAHRKSPVFSDEYYVDDEYSVQSYIEKNHSYFESSTPKYIIVPLHWEKAIERNFDVLGIDPYRTKIYIGDRDHESKISKSSIIINDMRCKKTENGLEVIDTYINDPFKDPFEIPSELDGLSISSMRVDTCGAKTVVLPDSPSAKIHITFERNNANDVDKIVIPASKAEHVKIVDHTTILPTNYNPIIVDDIKDNFNPYQTKIYIRDENGEEHIHPLSANLGQNDNYRYRIEDGEVKLTSYIGKSKDVVIPCKINGMPVTEVLSGTFDKFAETHPDSIVFPKSIKVIHSNAVSYSHGFNSLKSITICNPNVVIEENAISPDKDMWGKPIDPVREGHLPKEWAVNRDDIAKQLGLIGNGWQTRTFYDVEPVKMQAFVSANASRDADNNVIAMAAERASTSQTPATSKTHANKNKIKK